MFKKVKILSLFLILALLFLYVVFHISTQKVLALGNAVTMAGFGKSVVPANTEGDTWDGAWLANGKQYMQNNDGYGFGTGNTSRHDCISELSGTPETPSSLSGVNLNPGTKGTFFGATYSTGIYEVDGVLYHNICYSNQNPNDFRFYHTSIMKSIDGGANWINHLGQTNVLPPDSLSGAMFQNENWGQMNFVKYGQGGSTPNIDNAQTYVYLSDWNGFLARISRADLPSLDKTKLKFYIGGDGMLESSWSSNIADGIAVPAGSNSIVYNYGLDRYISTKFVSNSWGTPEIESSTIIYEAPHPWGPWTELIFENAQNKQNDNLCWTYLLPKFTSADGQKMWMSATGRAPYGLQFVPVYLTNKPVQTYEAESATLTGTATATSKSGYTGSGYVTGFDAVGDKCQFNVNVGTTGAYILKFRYNTSAHQTISFLANGQKIEVLELGKSEQSYATWTEMSTFAWLTSGSNTLSIQVDSGDSGNLNLDKLSLALYSTVAGSLPGCNPLGTQTPYGGSNWSLPGTIQAENYDIGTDGTAYHDSDVTNQGGASYRSSDGVDIENCSDTGGGYDICWTSGGEWLEYTTNISTGTYNITARVASLAVGGSITFKLDGVSLGTVNVPATGGWQTWQDVTLNNISITGGTGKVLRLEITGGSFNFNKFSLTSTAPTPTFNDNFESGSTQWTSASGTWSIVADGTQVYKQTNGSVGVQGLATAGTSTWTNYTVSADVKRMSGDSAAILGRMNSSTTFYQFEISSANQWMLQKSVNNIWTVIQSGSFTNNTSTFYNLSMGFNGNAITLKINGSQVWSGTDSAITSGKIALKTWQGTAEFDNVNVQ